MSARGLNLEKEILKEFITYGSSDFNSNDFIEVYFAAQHHGLPTRLLDWSTNPLAALFFAVEKDEKEQTESGEEKSSDGMVYILVPQELIPEDPPKKDDKNFPRAILTIRHPYVEDAVKEMFWHDKKYTEVPILPILPDSKIGRIRQQSSCFTFHRNAEAEFPERTKKPIIIDGDSKPTIRKELHQMNINQFTIYRDLDHLSLSIRKLWELR